MSLMPLSHLLRRNRVHGASLLKGQFALSLQGLGASGTRRIERLTKLSLAQSWSVVPSISAVAATAEGTQALCQVET
jgi:hypothetical protein